MNKQDILIFLSDQHNAKCGGFAGDELVQTPNLDEIAVQGTLFENAYTSCPLCVPARVSMLTGHSPSKTGVFTNEGVIRGDEATFIHSIAAEGYETVLCGRMHFVGDDQRHGFTKRIMGEFTPLHLGRGGMRRKDLGRFRGTTGAMDCLREVGSGTSPVLEYDKAVINAALEYLKQDHEKPQCIVVGTYAPHCSYVAPKELFDYYRGRVQLPKVSKQKLNYSHPAISHKEQKATDDMVLDVRAAYFGMVTNLDRQIGMVRDAWKKYLNRSNRKGVFAYLSDHGDQIGDRDIYGKQTFYEASARIPLIFEGDGIQKNHKVKGAVSIMDLGPTLCEMIGATMPPEQDGKSLVKQINNGKDNIERHVYSEFIEKKSSDCFIPCRMVRKDNWKLISYANFEEYDLLFDLEKDPNELCNVIQQYPQKAEAMKELLNEGWDIENELDRYKRKLAHTEILTKWGQTVDVEENDRYSFEGMTF